MDYKKILIRLRKVIAVLFSMGFDKHLDYDQNINHDEETNKEEDE